MTIFNSNLPPMRRIKSIHFVGIGGAGMGGIAEVLFNQGYRISGSDLNSNAMIKRLKSLGITIYPNHCAEHIKNVDVVVRSSAIPLDNPEIKAAHAARIPVVPRAQMLGELMRFRQGIAVAGTHGKTTTTSLITSLLAEGGLDPTFVIGGLLNSAGTNARLGASPYLVAEADESDASFLYLHPHIAVVTNIDADHMSTYDGDFNKLRLAFIDFLHHLPFYGLAVLCQDDPTVKDILLHVSRPMLTYGFDQEADIQAYDVTYHDFKTHFKVRRADHASVLEIHLNLPGQHNVLNALAAIAVASDVGVVDAAIIAGLEKFSGVGRRLQVLGNIQFTPEKTALLIDDYGHHPREIAATLQAIRAGKPNRRIVMIYQPHRYTRTHDLFNDFTEVLGHVDNLIMLEVYSAGEAAIPGADSRSLCDAIRARGKIDPILINNNDTLAETLANLIKTDDIILMQGAGNIGTLAANLAATYSIHYPQATHS